MCLSFYEPSSKMTLSMVYTRALWTKHKCWPTNIFRKHFKSANMPKGHWKENSKCCTILMSAIACKPPTWLHTQRLFHCPEWKAIFKGTPGIAFKSAVCMSTLCNFLWRSCTATAGESISLSPLEVWVQSLAFFLAKEKKSFTSFIFSLLGLIRNHCTIWLGLFQLAVCAAKGAKGWVNRTCQGVLV